MPVGLALAAGAPAAAAGWRAELAEGFLEVRRRTWVWVTVAAATISLLLALAPLFVLGPLTAEDVYGDSAVYGVVMAAFGAGAVAGALMGLRWRPRRPMLVANLVAVPWPLIGIGMALGWPLALVLAAAVAGGVGLALFDVLWETALAEHIPPRALSRVSAFDWMGSLALLPLGYAVAGPVADAVGLGTVLIAGGLVTMVVSAAAALPRQTRTLRSLERPG
jgi:MFS family permease